MKKKAFCVLLFLGMSLFGSTQEPILDKVTVNKRQILVNNKPYIIKGICYHPVPVGKSERSFESFDKDLELTQPISPPARAVDEVLYFIAVFLKPSLLI